LVTDFQKRTISNWQLHGPAFYEQNGLGCFAFHPQVIHQTPVHTCTCMLLLSVHQDHYIVVYLCNDLFLNFVNKEIECHVDWSLV
jgi:hypothetical protein